MGYTARMNDKASSSIVYYDGACPGCVRDRRRYQALAGKRAEGVAWLDITGREAELREAGIDPAQALRELHVMDQATGRIHSELDAYILLMRRTIWLRPLAFFIGLPIARPLLSRAYRTWVDRRLCRTGRA